MNEQMRELNKKISEIRERYNLSMKSADIIFLELTDLVNEQEELRKQLNKKEVHKKIYIVMCSEENRVEGVFIKEEDAKKRVENLTVVWCGLSFHYFEGVLDKV